MANGARAVTGSQGAPSGALSIERHARPFFTCWGAGSLIFNDSLTEQRLSMRLPEPGSIRYDRVGRPWTFVRGQFYQEPERGIKVEQLVYKDAAGVESVFRANFRLWDADGGSDARDLVHVTPPQMLEQLTTGQGLNQEMLAVIVMVAYELQFDKLPPWTWAMERAAKIHKQFYVNENGSPT